MITRTRRGRPRATSAGGAIAKWLFDYLEREGLTVSMAATKIGVGQSTLSDWLRGAKKPGPCSIDALIDLGMPLETYREQVVTDAEKKMSARR